MNKILLGVVATALSIGLLFSNAKPDGLLHVFILNVGQGDAIFARTPQGTTFLIDGGPEKKVLTELKEVLPFWGASIDYLVSTHPDRDHIEGLIAVLKRYPVRHVLFTGVYKKDYFSQEFLRLIKEKNIPVILAREDGDIALTDGVTFDVLFPFTPIIRQETVTNNLGLIAKLIYGEHEILLTADAELPEEEMLISHGVNLQADILKSGHHGSKTSSSEAFLSAINPQFVAISVGLNNSYHHPHLSTLKRYKEHQLKILRTDLDGRIEFIFSPKEIVEIKTQSKREISAPSERSFSSKDS
ncbi:MAG: MBL fold metallo-hydrolase [Patescibacteria group bacterium]